MSFVSKNKLLTTISLAPSHFLALCVRPCQRVSMSQHIIQYTVGALSKISHGSLVCITLTATSCGCLVAEQMFSEASAIQTVFWCCCSSLWGSGRVAWLSKLYLQGLNFKGHVWHFGKIQLFTVLLRVRWADRYILMSANTSKALYLTQKQRFKDDRLWFYSWCRDKTEAAGCCLVFTRYSWGCNQSSRQSPSKISQVKLSFIKGVGDLFLWTGVNTTNHLVIISSGLPVLSLTAVFSRGNVHHWRWDDSQK